MTHTGRAEVSRVPYLLLYVLVALRLMVLVDLVYAAARRGRLDLFA